MKKRIYQLAVVILIFGCVFLIALQIKNDDHDTTIYTDEYVSKDEVAFELAFTFYSKEDWSTFLEEYKQDVLTYEMMNTIVEQVGTADYIQIEKKSSTQEVSRAEWNAVYEQILDFLDTENKVSKQTILIREIMEGDDGSILLTNQEDYVTELPENYFTPWTAYECFVIDGECVGISGIATESVLLENVYVKDATAEQMNFLYEGTDYQIKAEIEESETTGVCDLEWTSGKLTKVYAKSETIEGELLSYDDNTIEIENYGRIEHSEKLPVYQVYGGVEEKSLSDIVLGNMKVQYVVAGEEVCAVLLTSPAQIQNIRVLLLADDGTLFRQEVYLKTATDCTVINGSSTTTIPADTVISIADQGLVESQNTFYVTPTTEDGETYICDAAGNVLGNAYQGRIEVRYTENGYTIVNELPMEQYLYAVVPSEMPSSYGTEALRAQAVCARSYAYIQLIKADYASYGAHIDDSTSYQVYNKTARTAESIDAVDATSGQVMTYQGNVIEAYYFSTSSGYTDDISVWNQEDDGTYGYLKKVCLNQIDDMEDLSDEETFRNYIKNTNTGYDSEIKYYRWRAEASFEGKEADLASVLKTRKAVVPESILYYELDGTTIKDNMDDFGKLEAINVMERSASGSILNLRLTYENGIVDVKTEYNIRRILGVGLTTIGFADGSNADMTILPSAFCAVIPVEDGSYVIYGGGYGHGLGMSQNGANGLAKEGKSYQDILNFFYQNIEFENIYDVN